jgi:hypothetical protein
MSGHDDDFFDAIGGVPDEETEPGKKPNFLPVLFCGLPIKDRELFEATYGGKQEIPTIEFEVPEDEQW